MVAAFRLQLFVGWQIGTISLDRERDREKRKREIGLVVIHKEPM